MKLKKLILGTGLVLILTSVFIVSHSIALDREREFEDRISDNEKEHTFAEGEIGQPPITPEESTIQTDITEVSSKNKTRKIKGKKGLSMVPYDGKTAGAIKDETATTGVNAKRNTPNVWQPHEESNMLQINSQLVNLFHDSFVSGNIE